MFAAAAVVVVTAVICICCFVLFPVVRNNDRAIDRASKRGGGSGSSHSVEMCIAGRPVSDRTFVLACLGVFAAGSLASWGRVYALAMATAGVAEKLRARLFAALMLQEKEFFDEKKAGELAPILAEVGAVRYFLRCAL